MGFKKRGAVYSVIALMLCVAVYLNWNYSKQPGDQSVSGIDSVNKTLGQSVLVDSTSGDELDSIITGDSGSAISDDYFSDARLSRQRARDEAVSILNNTIESANASEEAKAVANTNIQVMADYALVESSIENLVKAKGYKDCVVFVSDNGVNVIVSKTEEGLTSVDVAKIQDIVMDQASVTADQIHIMETA